MNRPPFQYALRGEFADGQSLEFVPDAVRPLGLDEIKMLSRQPDASVTLQWLAQNPKINGETVRGTATMNGRLTFSEPVTVYALLPNGGWLPPPFVSPQNFLLDRNVVANFNKLRNNRNFTDRKAHQFWTRFFEQGTAFFNPLPYALEGSACRVPTFAEFVEAFDQGIRDIEQTFSRSAAVRYSNVQYQLGYSQLQAMHANTPREIEFLCEIAPLVAERTSEAKLHTSSAQILAAADRLKVDRQSLALLIALSCLFEDPRSDIASIGRRILEPTRTYDAADAYNATCDLRHIEMTALGHAWVTKGPFALCTSDRAVASLWCALSIRDVVETGTGPEFKIDLSQELFPLLSDDAISDLARLLYT